MDFLHNHTLFSDGADTVLAMAKAARELGVNRFGISDHLVLLPKNTRAVCTWSMYPETLDAYFAAISEAKSELNDGNFQVLAGLEVDYFDETIDATRDIIQRYPLDYVIGSCHYVGDFGVDECKEDWERLGSDGAYRIWDEYLDCLLKIANLGERQCFNFFAHLDLPKKFGYRMPIGLADKLNQLLDAIKNSGLGMEINLAGLTCLCQEEYPGAAVIEKAHALGIPMVVNGDCHSVGHLQQRVPLAQRYHLDSRSVL